MPNMLTNLEKTIEMQDRSIGDVLEYGFVNVLFSMKLLNESFENLSSHLSFRDKLMINKYYMQRDIRYFFLNADNPLALH
ncbi:hypothetical protein [Paenibacillus sp. MY03]|uniref:hypothetical protein n=1 Tax=Paenibacillus sp. MY03 TaxID=302980 RepID=UPI00117D95B1|nr:hypothetical protein [Paenibacillus sp. MY03]